ncbi:hypothetical protein GCM10028811_04330 [Uliginosibacterium sediminicola]
MVGDNPDDYLARVSGSYCRVNYSDYDALSRFVDVGCYDYILPGCNDLSYKMCARLGLSSVDGLAATETINNKRSFRAFAREINVPSPQAYFEGQIPTGKQLIVKPVDAFSGRGVAVVNSGSCSDLQRAISRACAVSAAGECVIEDYIEGQLYSHSCFIDDGNVVLDFFVEEHGTANPFVVDTSRVTWDMELKIVSQFRECIQKIARELNLVDGLVHTQFVVRDGEFWLIEITRRCPGDLYSQLIELSTGFDYAYCYARYFLKDRLGLPCAVDKKNWILRHTMSLSSTGDLGFFSFHFPLKIERFVPLKSAGSQVKESPYGRMAILFVRADDAFELDEIFQRTLRRELYSVGV